MAELDEKKAPVAEEKKASKPAKEKVPFGERMSHFFRGYKSELKKITWSPWNQVGKNTLVVIVTVVICAAAIGLLDLVFNQGIVALGALI